MFADDNATTSANRDPITLQLQAAFQQLSLKMTRAWDSALESIRGSRLGDQLLPLLQPLEAALHSIRQRVNAAAAKLQPLLSTACVKVTGHSCRGAWVNAFMAASLWVGWAVNEVIKHSVVLAAVIVAFVLGILLGMLI